MDQDLAKRIVKKISSRTANMKLSQNQMFILGHKRFDIQVINAPQAAHMDRYIMFVSLEKNVKMNKMAQWALNWTTTVARGLAPGPQGEVATVGMDVIGVLEQGQNRSSAVTHDMGAAWQSGLKSLRPAKESADNQFEINDRYMHAHKAAKNAGMWAAVESDGNLVRFCGTNDFSQFSIWKQNMDKRDLFESMAQTFKLGSQNGRETITIDGAPVYLWDV